MSVIDEITKEIPFLIAKIMRHANTGSISKINITPSQIIMLVSIRDHGECKLNTLAKERNISPPTATGLIDRLEMAGYVKRSADSEDRRATIVSLTKKGEQMVQNYMKMIGRIWKDILMNLTIEEQKQYLNILRKIVNGLEKKANLK